LSNSKTNQNDVTNQASVVLNSLPVYKININQEFIDPGAMIYLQDGEVELIEKASKIELVTINDIDSITLKSVNDINLTNQKNTDILEVNDYYCYKLTYERRNQKIFCLL
jgi:hypothetical protein